MGGIKTGQWINILVYDSLGEKDKRVNSRMVEILLVEDNPGDARLTREAFNEGRLLNNLRVIGDGVEALAYLRQEAPYSNSLRPDLILLDLNLPKKDGREVLAEIKADQSLKTIPVVVLTTSAAQEDITRAYGSYANCYITKPVNLEQFLCVIQSIESFWLSLVTLPLQGGVNGADFQD